MAEFDSSIDYKQLHLDWLYENPGFKPKVPYPVDKYESYREYMKSMYAETIRQQKTAYMFLKDDQIWMSRKITKPVTQQVASMFGVVEPKDVGNFFVTFNFDPLKFKVDGVLNAIQRFYDKVWVEKAYGVMEAHCKEGIRPHFMMKLQVNKYKTFGKLRDKLKEQTLYTQFMSGLNFLDIKQFKDYHTDYIALDKTPEKLEYLEQDVLWRIENNIPEYLEKK